MKKVLALVIAVLMVMGAVACSNTGTANNPTTSTSKTEAAVGTTGSDNSSKDEQITLHFTWWGGDGRNAATYDAINAYTAKHPNITIIGEPVSWDSYYEKMLTQLSGGTAADIIQADYKWASDIVLQGMPFVNMKDGVIDHSEWAEMPAEYSGNSEYEMGIATGINVKALWYNKEFFNKFNITASDDWSWQTILEVGEAVNKADPDSHLLWANGDNFYAFMLSYMLQRTGKHMIDTENYNITCSAEELTEYFDYVKALFETGTLAPIEDLVVYEGLAYASQVPEWLNGQWGMCMTYASNTLQVLNDSPFEIGTMLYPVMEGTTDTGISMMPTQLLCVNKASAHQKEAIEFVEWFLKDEEAITISALQRGIPANTAASKLLEEQGVTNAIINESIAVAAQHAGTAEGAFDTNKELNAAALDYIYQVAYGVLTPEKAASQTIDAMNAILATMK